MPRVSEQADVVVIGGGAIGLAVALEASAAGRSVCLLEQTELGSGASHGNCGLLTPSHSLPLTQPGMVRRVLGWMLREDAPIYVRSRFDLGFLAWGLRFARHCNTRSMDSALRGRAALLELSRSLFDDWVAHHALAVEYETAGLLEVYATAQGRDQSHAAHALLAEHGIASVAYTAAEVQAREPALREGMAGGQWYPSDAHLRPDALVRELARCARAAGAHIVERAEVTGLEIERGKLVGVQLAEHRIACTQLVLCAGAWSPRLGRALGLRLPVQPGKGYSISSARPTRCPEVPLLLKEANMAVTPWPSGLRLGGTMEFAGLDPTLRRKRLDALRIGAARFLHEPLGADPIEWCGFRPMTPDELPLIGPAPRVPNAFVATGHGMMGMSMATGTAQLVREMLCGQALCVDPAPYAPQRFG